MFDYNQNLMTDDQNNIHHLFPFYIIYYIKKIALNLGKVKMLITYIKYQNFFISSGMILLRSILQLRQV